MIGIYKITNLINGKIYIGQSKDIEKRFKEHAHHSKFGVGKEIKKYGIENFSLEVLEQCEPKDLDEREEFYIKSLNAITDGYNSIQGGQHNIGESNSNAKLTEQEVYEIREAYKNNANQKETYEKFKNKVTFGSFQAIWQGRGWRGIHTDVYTEENKRMHKAVNVFDYSYLNKNKVLSDQDIFEIRESYKNRENRDSVYEKYADKISKSYFLKIWNGIAYPEIHMDVYTDENRDFQRKQSISIGSVDSKFTDDEVLYYRRKHAYEGFSIIDLYNEAVANGKNCTYDTFHDMISGRYYKRIDIPVIKFVRRLRSL